MSFLAQTEAIRRWLQKLKPQQRRQFVDSLYDVLSRSCSVAESVVKHYVRTHLRSIIRLLRSDDQAVYEVLSKTVRLLAKSSIIEAILSAMGKFRRRS